MFMCVCVCVSICVVEHKNLTGDPRQIWYEVAFNCFPSSPIYIYLYVCIYVCVCAPALAQGPETHLVQSCSLQQPAFAGLVSLYIYICIYIYIYIYIICIHTN